MKLNLIDSIFQLVAIFVVFLGYQYVNGIKSTPPTGSEGLGVLFLVFGGAIFGKWLAGNFKKK